MGRRRSAVATALAVLIVAPAAAQDVRLPVLVPLTGFVALEGTSQRNGALLAANLLDAPYTEAKVGRRVEVVFQPLNDDVTLPQFRLAE